MKMKICIRALIGIALGATLALPVLSDTPWNYPSLALIFACLACISMWDIATLEIPQLLLNFLLVCVIADRIITVVVSGQLWSVIVNSLGGALLCFGFFAGVYYVSLKLLKKEGIGFGDVKLMSVAGLLLGVGKSVFAVAAASVCACVILLILKALTKTDREYPFAPFLSSGIAVSCLFYDRLITAYFGLLDKLLI